MNCHMPVRRDDPSQIRNLWPAETQAVIERFSSWAGTLAAQGRLVGATGWSTRAVGRCAQLGDRERLPHHQGRPSRARRAAVREPPGLPLRWSARNPRRRHAGPIGCRAALRAPDVSNRLPPRSQRRSHERVPFASGPRGSSWQTCRMDASSTCLGAADDIRRASDTVRAALSFKSVGALDSRVRSSF